MRWIIVLVIMFQVTDCGTGSHKSAGNSPGASLEDDSPAQQDARERMVHDQIAARGVRDQRVLAAMRIVARHLFVPPSMVPYAYRDSPLPIGNDQTISQPYIVAFMTEALKLKPSDRVLEIGTGSGYQAAVLSELCREVYSIEIVEPLGKQAAARLEGLGYQNIHLRIGDGYRGWPEQAPFDAIIVTAAPEQIPPALLDQLANGGRMVLPVGGKEQVLVRVRRTQKQYTVENLFPVMFVPMVKEEGVLQAPQN
jgi:protein-L-isoaspartate(D-aspartate) O-methyltransferase